MPQGKCNNCHHSTRSRTHHIRCAGMTLQQWHASKIGRSIRQSTPRRTAGEIFAGQREFQPVDETRIMARMFANAINRDLDPGATA